MVSHSKIKCKKKTFCLRVFKLNFKIEEMKSSIIPCDDDVRKTATQPRVRRLMDSHCLIMIARCLCSIVIIIIKIKYNDVIIEVKYNDVIIFDLDDDYDDAA